ncbi:hypothetical protein ACWGB8_26690 [Kitasatospora sp. NPDC054939]
MSGDEVGGGAGSGVGVTGEVGAGAGRAVADAEERDSGAPEGAAPLVVADYWRGDFVLRRPDAEPSAADPSPARLGRSGITVRGRDLADLLAPAYEAFRS